MLKLNMSHMLLLSINEPTVKLTLTTETTEKTETVGTLFFSLDAGTIHGDVVYHL